MVDGWTPPSYSDLCIATFPKCDSGLSIGPSCMEIHEPPWEQTTSLKSLVRGTERPLLSGTLETVLVFWTLTWISCDHSEVVFLFCSLFLLFRPFSLWFSSISFTFPKFLGCMDLVRSKWTSFPVTTFSPSEDCVVIKGLNSPPSSAQANRVNPGSGRACCWKPAYTCPPSCPTQSSPKVQGSFWRFGYKVLEGTGGKKKLGGRSRTVKNARDGRGEQAYRKEGKKGENWEGSIQEWKGRIDWEEIHGVSSLERTRQNMILLVDPLAPSIPPHGAVHTATWKEPVIYDFDKNCKDFNCKFLEVGGGCCWPPFSLTNHALWDLMLVILLKDLWQSHLSVLVHRAMHLAFYTVSPE